MPHESTKPRTGDPGPRQGLCDQQEPRQDSPQEIPAQLESPVLPRVAEARARDQLARAALRGLIPDRMNQIERGRAWQKKAAAERAAVFPPKEGEGTE